MLTRQQHNAIAEIIERNTTIDHNDAIAVQEELFDQLADYFAQDNPHFDRGKFFLTCKL